MRFLHIHSELSENKPPNCVEFSVSPDVFGQLGLESLLPDEDQLRRVPPVLNSFLPNDAGFLYTNIQKALDEIIYSCWIFEQLRLLTFL